MNSSSVQPANKGKPYIEFLLMSQTEPRITGPTLKVLGAFLASPTEEMSGAEITRATKLASGTLYPILFRLEGAKWLESRWESEDPAQLGRPRRRFYRITAVGAAKARLTFDELAPAFGRSAWA
jgi:DNA-binding PadR family transcriptional regulator